MLPIPLVQYKAGGFECIQMVADGWFRDIEAAGDFPGRHVPLCKKLQDAPPGGIREGFESIIQTAFLLCGAKPAAARYFCAFSGWI